MTEAKENSQRLFLAAFQYTLTSKEACDEVGISEATLNRWRREDPTFEERFELTNDARGDFLEERMFNILNWATNDPEGYKLIIQKPTLFTFALKGLKREKYGDRGGGTGEEARRLLEGLLRMTDKDEGEGEPPGPTGLTAGVRSEIEELLDRLDET